METTLHHIRTLAEYLAHCLFEEPEMALVPVEAQRLRSVVAQPSRIA